MKVLSSLVLATFLVMQIHQISGSKTVCGKQMEKTPEEYGAYTQEHGTATYGMFPWFARYFCSNKDLSPASAAILSEKYVLLTYNKTENCQNPSLYYLKDRTTMTRAYISKRHAVAGSFGDIFQTTVLELKDKIRFSKFARPICLPTNDILEKTTTGKFHLGYYRVPLKSKEPMEGSLLISKLSSIEKCKSVMLPTPSPLPRLPFFSRLICTFASAYGYSYFPMDYGVTSKEVNRQHFLVGSSLLRRNSYVVHLPFNTRDISEIIRITGLNATGTTPDPTATEPPSSGGSIYNIVNKHANK